MRWCVEEITFPAVCTGKSNNKTLQVSFLQTRLHLLSWDVARTSLISQIRGGGGAHQHTFKLNKLSHRATQRVRSAHRAVVKGGCTGDAVSTFSISHQPFYVCVDKSWNKFLVLDIFLWFIFFTMHLNGFYNNECLTRPRPRPQPRPQPHIHMHWSRRTPHPMIHLLSRTWPNRSHRALMHLIRSPIPQKDFRKTLP